jgi:hypothetical protein
MLVFQSGSTAGDVRLCVLSVDPHAPAARGVCPMVEMFELRGDGGAVRRAFQATDRTSRGSQRRGAGQASEAAVRPPSTEVTSCWPDLLTVVVCCSRWWGHAGLDWCWDTVLHETREVCCRDIDVAERLLEEQPAQEPVRNCDELPWRSDQWNGPLRYEHLRLAADAYTEVHRESAPQAVRAREWTPVSYARFGGFVLRWDLAKLWNGVGAKPFDSVRGPKRGPVGLVSSP